MSDNKNDVAISKRRQKTCIKLGKYLVKHQNDSIRDIAKHFGMTRTTVHRDLHLLEFIDYELYSNVFWILRSHCSPYYRKWKMECYRIRNE